MIKTKIIASLFILSILISSGLTYHFTYASFSGSLEDLPYYVGIPQPYDYIITQNSTHVFRFNCTTGEVITSTNISSLFDNVPTESIFFVKDGRYDLGSSPIGNVSIIGESISNIPNTEVPALSIDGLNGTVFYTSYSINAVQIYGQYQGIRLENFGVEFTGASSGNGIDIKYSSGRHGSDYAVLNNLRVIGIDDSHYAYNFENVQHFDVRTCISQGGGYMNITGSDNGGNIHYGNTQIDNSYHIVDRDMISNPVVNIVGAYSAGVNLYLFNNFEVYASNNYDVTTTLMIKNSSYIQFNRLTLECNSSMILNMNNHATDIYFAQPFINSPHPTSNITIDYTCTNVNFYGGTIALNDYVYCYSTPSTFMFTNIPVGNIIGDAVSIFSRGNTDNNAILQINSLYGNFQILGSDIAIRHCGFAYGVTLGASTQTVTFPWKEEPDTNYGVVVTPNWDTTFYIQNKTTTTFDVGFGTVAPSGATIDYWMFREVT